MGCVLGSTNLAVWSALGTAINELGSIVFTDADTNVCGHKVYSAQLQSAPKPR